MTYTATFTGRRRVLSGVLRRIRAVRPSGDRGSTIPLILGFFVLAMVMTAGAIAAGQAFVQQRDLQELCDGAVAAAAASAANLDRVGDPVDTSAVRFSSVVDQAVAGYLARGDDQGAVQTDARLSADESTVDLRCVRIARIPFGALFGKPSGVRHVVTSSAREPTS
jgi:putative Flp pilus-assembly TadE/G-like protein